MEPLIGMIVPPAAGEVPAEARVLAPEGVRFAARGLGLGELTIDGYGAVIDRVAELARDLEKEGADAVALMGTSLSFFRGSAFNDQLLKVLREAIGLPATTMSCAIREALQAVRATRVAVGTAYVDEVNERLREFLQDSGFDVLSMQGLGLKGVAEIHAVTEEAVIELGVEAVRQSRSAPDAVLISCGGLISSNLAPGLEERTGIPAIASATAGVWASLRLVGITCRSPALGVLGRVPDIPDRRAG